MFATPHRYMETVRELQKRNKPEIEKRQKRMAAINKSMKNTDVQVSRIMGALSNITDEYILAMKEKKLEELSAMRRSLVAERDEVQGELESLTLTQTGKEPTWDEVKAEWARLGIAGREEDKPRAIRFYDVRAVLRRDAEGRYLEITCKLRPDSGKIRIDKHPAGRVLYS